MEQSTPQTVELSTDEQEQLKKSKVQEFIKRLEKQEQDPKYRHMMDNFRRAQKDFNDFMKLPKEQRSKILFGIQCQLIQHEVAMNPDSPYNWRRIENEERQAKRASMLAKTVG